MKKYKTLLIILLVFLSCLSVYMLYCLVNNVYSLCYYIKYQFPDMTFLIVRMTINIIFDIAIIGFSVLGIVTFAKIFQDKQLFATPAEQPAMPNNDEPSITDGEEANK